MQNVLLLIDISGSCIDYLDTIFSDVKTFIEKFDYDRCGIIFFSTGAELQLSLGNTKASWKEYSGHINHVLKIVAKRSKWYRNGTLIEPAIKLAIQQFRLHDPTGSYENQHVFVFTDMGINFNSIKINWKPYLRLNILEYDNDLD